jgi:hypothetical protein
MRRKEACAVLGAVNIRTDGLSLVLLPFESVRARRIGSARNQLFLPPSLCNLCALCASVVLWEIESHTPATQSLSSSSRSIGREIV